MANTDGVPAERKIITPEEMDVAMSGPALLGNKFYVTVTPTGLRLAYCESFSEVDLPKFRGAVFIPFPDAVALRDLLNRTLDKVQVSVQVGGSDGQQ